MLRVQVRAIDRATRQGLTVSVCIDAHVHVVERGFWPPRWFEYAAAQWARQGERRDALDIVDRIEAGLEDQGGQRLLAQLTEAGVDKAVMFTVDWELGMESTPPVSIGEIHARYGEIVRSSEGRLLAFAGIDPRRPDALSLVEEAFDVHGLMGLKLYPPTGFFPYEDVVNPLYEACLERNLPVAIHTGATLGLLRPRFANPLYIQDVQRRYPELTIWIAHAGAPYWWDQALAVARAGINTYLEISSWETLAIEDEGLLVKRLGVAINSLGPDRLLFGSDHISGERVRGFGSYFDWITWLRELPAAAKKYDVHISDAHVDAILGENTARCLGISI